MSQKEKNKTPPELDDQLEEAAAKEAAEEPAEAEAGATDPLMDELEALKDQAARQEEKYLRLAAEYDNFRKRSQKEKESIYADAKAINDHRAAEAEAETIEDTSAQEA